MKVGLTVLTVIAVLVLGLGIAAQTERWPFAVRAYDIGPMDTPGAWPKAHCLDRIDTVNVIFWNEKPRVNKTGLDAFNPDNRLASVSPELAAHADEVVDKFWSGDRSYIVTSDRTKAIPNNDRQISIVFKETALGRMATFALLFSGKERYEKYEAQSESTRLDSPSLKLNIDVTPDELSNYIRSLKDLTTGRCDKPVSKYIVGHDESNWKFFPPYDERYRTWKTN